MRSHRNVQPESEGQSPCGVLESSGNAGKPRGLDPHIRPWTPFGNNADVEKQAVEGSSLNDDIRVRIKAPKHYHPLLTAA